MSTPFPTPRLLAIALVALPLAAQGQVHKCPQAGGGTSYQSTPCARPGKPDAPPTAAQLNAAQAALPKPEPRPFDDPYARPAAIRPGPPEPLKPGLALPPASAKPVLDQWERRRRCTIALNNSNVLKTGPSFHYDAAGNKVVTPMYDRSAEIAEADRDAARYCD